MKKLAVAAALSLALIGSAGAESRPPSQRPQCFTFITIWFFHIAIPVACDTTVAPKPPRAR